VDHLHNKWGGLLIKKFNSIFGVQGSNFKNDIIVVKNGILTKYFIIRLLKLGPYLGRLSGLFSHLNYFKPSFGGDTCQKLIAWKITKTKIYFIIYIIIISNIIIFNNKKKYTITKIWLMISHMSFMISQQNVPHHWHIILPHHVLMTIVFNNSLIMTLRLLVIFLLYD